jgi:cell division GTPase FtsZ
MQLRAAVDVIRSEHHPAARVLFGAVARTQNSGRVCVTVIASSGPSAHPELSSMAAEQALDVAA